MQKKKLISVWGIDILNMEYEWNVSAFESTFHRNGAMMSPSTPSWNKELNCKEMSGWQFHTHARLNIKWHSFLLNYMQPKHQKALQMHLFLHVLDVRKNFYGLLYFINKLCETPHLKDLRFSRRGLYVPLKCRTFKSHAVSHHWRLYSPYSKLHNASDSIDQWLPCHCIRWNWKSSGFVRSSVIGSHQ
jgi:hypothetical protein